MTIDLSHLDNFVGQIQRGEMSADANDIWDEAGEAHVHKVLIKESQTGAALVLEFSLKHAATGQAKDIGIVLPGAGETPAKAGRTMGKVGATLYAMMGAGIEEQGNRNLTAFLARVQKHLETNTVKVKYSLENAEKFLEKSGKTITQQYLRSFTRIESVPRSAPVAAVQPAAQPAPQPAAAPAVGTTFF